MLFLTKLSSWQSYLSDRPRRPLTTWVSFKSVCSSGLNLAAPCHGLVPQGALPRFLSIGTAVTVAARCRWRRRPRAAQWTLAASFLLAASGRCGRCLLSWQPRARAQQTRSLSLRLCGLISAASGDLLCPVGFAGRRNGASAHRAPEFERAGALELPLAVESFCGMYGVVRLSTQVALDFYEARLILFSDGTADVITGLQDFHEGIVCTAGTWMLPRRETTDEQDFAQHCGRDL